MPTVSFHWSVHTFLPEPYWTGSQSITTASQLGDSNCVFLSVRNLLLNLPNFYIAFQMSSSDISSGTSSQTSQINFCIFLCAHLFHNPFHSAVPAQYSICSESKIILICQCLACNRCLNFLNTVCEWMNKSRGCGVEESPKAAGWINRVWVGG